MMSGFVDCRFKMRSLFSSIEDEQLKNLFGIFGSDWMAVSKKMRNRSPRQCRDRYLTYLRDDLKVGDWSKDEDEFLLKCQMEMGNKWVNIAKLFGNRTDTSIKNRFNHLKQKGIVVLNHEQILPVPEIKSPILCQRDILFNFIGQENEYVIDIFANHTDDEDYFGI